MKEIKFRVWDSERCKYYWGNCNLCMTLSGYLMWQFGNNSPELLSKEHREACTIEQYIGLKDVNGKEIYEGDIVKVEGGYINSVVLFQKNAQFVASNKLGDFDLLHDGVHTVIGNIHENPELLKEEKKTNE